MARRESCKIDHKSVGKKSLRIFFSFVSIVCCACSVASAEDFAPFVIPAKPDVSSSIAFTSIEPILVESERMRVDAGHFYRGGERVRLWGVNFSFGASLPKHEDAPFIAARLAAAGVNAVRCHHLDTARWPRGRNWGRRSRCGSRAMSSRRGRKWRPRCAHPRESTRPTRI